MDATQIDQYGAAARKSSVPFVGGGKGTYLYGNVMTITIGAFMFGYSMSSMNSCMANVAMSFEWCGWSAGETQHEPIVQCEKSTWYQNYVNNALFIGAAIGCVIAGYLSKFGRRQMLMYTDVLFIASGTALACSNGIEMLIVCRFIQGLGTGSVTCLGPMFLSEVVPKEQRGKWGAINEVMIAFGILASITLGNPQELPNQNDFTTNLTFFDLNWWRLVQFCIVIPAALQLFLFLRVYTWESPMYLMSQRNVAMAESLLTQLGRPLNSISQELKELDAAVANDANAKSLLQAIRSPKWRHGIFVGGMLSAIQQLSGINLLTTTSNEMFMKAGLTKEMVHMASDVMAVLNIPMCLVAARYCDSLGRRFLLIVGLCGMSAGMGIGFIGSFFSEQVFGTASVIAIYTYVIFFFVSLGPVCWIYIGEIYPSEVRGAGCGFASSMNWIMTFVVVFAVKFLTLPVIFAGLVATNLLSLAWVHHYIVETKGSAIENCPLYDGLEDDDPADTLKA